MRRGDRMGLGYSFKCSKCSKKYEILPGIGMLFPQVYEDTVAKLKNGRFGKAWKELYENTENVAIDAEKRVYLCPSCGYWKNEPGLSLYVADNKRAISDVKNGCPVFYGEDSLPAMMGNMPQYHLLKEYEHKCKKCGGKMKAVDDDEMLTLSCPKCGGAPDPENTMLVLWD